MGFDWHVDAISRDTPITRTYRNTQNIRRFLKAQCGDTFKFDRPFMAWLKDRGDRTMGEAADEGLRRRTARQRD